MKHRPVTKSDAKDLVAELRAMAVLGPGPDPKRLARAKEIRFQLQGQDWASLWMRAKLDEVYGHLEVLLSATRWQELISVDAVRSEIKGICSRFSESLSAGARAV